MPQFPAEQRDAGSAQAMPGTATSATTADEKEAKRATVSMHSEGEWVVELDRWNKLEVQKWQLEKARKKAQTERAAMAESDDSQSNPVDWGSEEPEESEPPDDMHDLEESEPPDEMHDQLYQHGQAAT